MARPMYNFVDPELELTDPNPDIHELFVTFNALFFDNQLGCVEVKWSPRMTLCAGLCRYVGRNGQCSIHMSKPLLSLRSRKDLIETLLHEMIHAYLFVVDNNRERESHGPKFQGMMKSINEKIGANISVYHSFHDEVKHFKKHKWRCDGPCRDRPPYFGRVARSMNRAPGPNDTWYAEHKSKCDGKFIKVASPDPKPKASKDSKKRKARIMEKESQKKISDIFPKVHNEPKRKKEEDEEVPSQNIGLFGGDFMQNTDENDDNKSKFDSPKKQVNFYGIIPFSGQGYTVGVSKSADQQRERAREHPLLSKWENSRRQCDRARSNGSNATVGSGEPKAGSSKDLKGQNDKKTEESDIIKKEKDGPMFPTEAEKAKEVFDVKNIEDGDIIQLSSGDEAEIDELCPACGIEYKSFLQTLEEHLQGCVMLQDW